MNPCQTCRELGGLRRLRGFRRLVVSLLVGLFATTGEAEHADRNNHQANQKFLHLGESSRRVLSRDCPVPTVGQPLILRRDSTPMMRPTSALFPISTKNRQESADADSSPCFRIRTARHLADIRPTLRANKLTDCEFVRKPLDTIFGKSIATADFR